MLPGSEIWVLSDPLGHPWNEAIPFEATHIALGNCQPHGPGCQVTSWAKNGCAALALGSGRWGGAWGPNANAARAAALSQVTAGRIVELHCAG